MNVPVTYFAYLKSKDGSIEKKRFEKRKDARKYISDNFDPKVHESCWTD